MSVVLDASALLAFQQSEPGSDVVEAHLAEDPWCAALNWSEVAQKVRASGADWPRSRAADQLRALGRGEHPGRRRVGPARWRQGEGLSLADRFCLALAARLTAPVWTADAAWGTRAPIYQIR